MKTNEFLFLSTLPNPERISVMRLEPHRGNGADGNQNSQVQVATAAEGEEMDED